MGAGAGSASSAPTNGEGWARWERKEEKGYQAQNTELHALELLHLHGTARWQPKWARGDDPNTTIFSFLFFEWIYSRLYKKSISPF